MKFGSDVPFPLRMNYNHIGDPLPSHLVPFYHQVKLSPSPVPWFKYLLLFS